MESLFAQPDPSSPLSLRTSPPLPSSPLQRPSSRADASNNNLSRSADIDFGFSTIAELTNWDADEDDPFRSEGEDNASKGD